ncbi:MAG: proteasome subunit beta [Acidimicrobiales bacterium]
MSLFMFPSSSDPGPDFAELLRRTGRGGTDNPSLMGPAPAGGGVAGASSGIEIRHGTTIVALRYADGVVMAGDRRATEGHSIAHRSIEKVFAGDHHSGVAIAGAAGPAVEMVRLFQTQLEHYEKVEGMALSLEGKANQLGQMIRANLPMAMQGLVVVPLFAGYDTKRGQGRIFTYDVTGGRYEEADLHATGSGGRDARTTIKLGYREDMSAQDAIGLAISGLYEAADEDSATGGPDVVRGIYPSVATITSAGFERIDDESVAEHFRVLIETKKQRGHRP